MVISTNSVGIVAEYNPFHKGHLHQLQKTRELCHPEAIVIVLSSNFVQRGEPAFIDKWARAKMAIQSGADLVLELPVVFSSHNAGVFANAAVDILFHTGVVNYISFGMENPSPDTKSIADILVQEPQAFKTSLHFFLDQGYSFVEARSRAIEQILPGASAILSKPNNNLAIAYLMRIISKNYHLQPIFIKRLGGGYHDTDLKESILGAKSIRHAIRDKNFSGIEHALPPSSSSILREILADKRAIMDYSNLWRTLRILLLRSSASDLRKYAELREGLENRFLSLAKKSNSWDNFVDLCISRRYPRGRIQRHLIHILLGLKEEDNRRYQREGPAYIRVLAANGRGRGLLKKMKSTATLPVITRASALDSPYAHRMFSMEHRATDIWETLLSKPQLNREARTPPLMVP